jgi:hypothetical protein
VIARRLRRVAAAALAIVLASAGAPGCLVLSVNPVYDDDTIAWDPDLVGTWIDAEDKASIEIERGEWRSYRVRYIHPIESGTLTGHLTLLNDHRFLDLMPVTGEDRGSFLIPVHAVLRVERSGDRLELTPLSYDWFADRLRAGEPVPGLAAAFDQKENVLLVTPTAALRSWLRFQPADSPMFGAAATFEKK